MKHKKTKKQIKETVKHLTHPVDFPLGSVLPVVDKFKMDKDWEEYFVRGGIRYIMRTQKDGVKINIK